MRRLLAVLVLLGFAFAALGQSHNPGTGDNYIPLSPGQHNVALTSSTALTVPANTSYATVCISTQAARYTTDGTTTPTSSVGQPLPIGCVALYGYQVITNFRAIAATAGATLDVEYFRQ